MKALSLKQPWASLVVLGAKRFETRSWATQHRGPLAIHASKEFGPAARGLCEQSPFVEAFAVPLVGADICKPDDLPLGVILGVVEVVDCWQSNNSDGPTRPGLTETELAFGDFRPGRWAWELRVLKRFAKPVPIAGHLGLWECPDVLLPEWDSNQLVREQP